ncbi:hypothetical protein [Aestuariivirga sp.]|uniref:hypothetical protein n=1 Tax=Aestuariivirga sp. TaxID=2650926 RepID=UPI0035932ED8
MSALRSDPPVHVLALRVTLAFAAALTVAEGYDLEFSFVSALVAASLALGPAMSPVALIVLPSVAWGLVTAAVLLLEAFASSLPPIFLVLTVGAFWIGFRLSSRNDRMNVIGLMILVVCCIVPLRLLAYPELTGEVVDDLVWNVLVGVVVAFMVGLVMRGPAEPETPSPRVDILPPLVAALVLTIGAYLVWVFEPPAPGAVMIGMIIALRADLRPGFDVAQDRIIGAIVGGVLAVFAATVVGIAPVLPTLFLVLMVVAWPLALRAVQSGPWQGAAIKAIYALGILVGEGFSPLFEDTAERLGIRIVGVLIGLLFATAAIVLFKSRKNADKHPMPGP